MNNTDTFIISVGNVTSKINEPTNQMVSSLYNQMSCYVPNYWFAKAFKKGIWDGKQHFFDKKTHEFPTGMIDKVIEILKDYEVEIKLKDMRKNVLTSEFNEDSITLASGKELRNYQVEAVKTVFNNKYEELPYIRGIINIATNGGKTVIAEAVVDKLYDLIPKGKMILFVTHSKEIAYQAKESFERDLGVSVGFLGDGHWKTEKVAIGLMPTLYSRMKNGTDEFNKLVKNTIGFIGDEVHHSSSSSWTEVLDKFTSASIRLGLTGTVDEKDVLKKYRLMSVTGDILIKIDNEFLISHGYSAKPECGLLPIDYPDIDNTMRYFGQDGEAGKLSYHDTYQKGIVKNDYRNWIIANLCDHEVKKSHQVLILVEHLEHGVAIENFLNIINPEMRYMFLHGELGSDERQLGLQLLKAGDVDVIISTSILDEGVDVPNINSIIYARGGKSLRKLLQGIGRGLRKKADGSSLKFYDFIDYTSDYLLTHSMGRYKVLKNEGFEITKLSLEKTLRITESDKQEFLEKYDTAYDDEVFVYVDEND